MDLAILVDVTGRKMQTDFEGILERYSNSLDARFEPIAKELSRLLILSDEINVNQKLNVSESHSISAVEDENLLEAKYGN